MGEHYFGKVEIQVRFLTRAPRDSIIDLTGYSIMDNTMSFYLMNVGSIPASRTKQSVCSSVEEFWSSKPAVGSSNLSRPARY